MKVFDEKRFLFWDTTFPGSTCAAIETEAVRFLGKFSKYIRGSVYRTDSTSYSNFVSE